MIASVAIQNFKCFSHLGLSLGKLTLFTGFNAGGKSTAIQPLLILAQGFIGSSAPNAYALNGALVRLGTVADVVPANTDDGKIVFSVSTSTTHVAWNLLTRAGERVLQVEDTICTGAATAADVIQNLKDLIYISAVREGTADSFPIPVQVERFGDVGADGRYAAYWYDRIVDEQVPDARLHPNEKATSVRKQLDAWMSTLFPGAQANVQSLPQVSLLSVQFRLSDIGPWLRPANVGYGLTYAFPILVALLTARDGQTIVIDSPEAHLHPYAQSEMGRLLAHFAAAGVQILVETHSDHLLNGTRLAVRDTVISAEDTRVHFFTGVVESGHGVITPNIDPQGRIDEWPEGFFDQTEKDLSRLAGWE